MRFRFILSEKECSGISDERLSSWQEGPLRQRTAIKTAYLLALYSVFPKSTGSSYFLFPLAVALKISYSFENHPRPKMLSSISLSLLVLLPWTQTVLSGPVLPVQSNLTRNGDTGISVTDQLDLLDGWKGNLSGGYLPLKKTSY